MLSRLIELSPTNTLSMSSTFDTGVRVLACVGEAAWVTFAGCWLSIGMFLPQITVAYGFDASMLVRLFKASQTLGGSGKGLTGHVEAARAELRLKFR